MAKYEVELRANAFTTVYVEAESAEDAQTTAMNMAYRHEIEAEVDSDDWEVDEIQELGDA